MGLPKTKQNQSAGEDSFQNQLVGDNTSQTIIGQQVNTTITYSSIPIEDVLSFSSTLSAQVTKQALVQCTEIATEIATERIKAFEEKWIPRVTQLDNVMDSLKDPKFQFMIRDASITAVKSSRKEDLDLLSELLACHVTKGKNLKNDAGIKRAIDIVNEIDADSLCALTVVDSLLNIAPVSSSIHQGICVLNDLYTKLLFTELPNGYAWIDHLSVLGTVSLLTGKFYTLDRICRDNFGGYICAGIRYGSDEYKKAIELLEQNGLSHSYLVDNELLEGYVRVPVVSMNNLGPQLQPVVDMYSKEQKLISSATNAFMSMWDSYDTLRRIRYWFESIPVWFRINSIGHALAQTNAKRCDPTFPDLM